MTKLNSNCIQKKYFAPLIFFNTALILKNYSAKKRNILQIGFTWKTSQLITQKYP